MAIPSINYDLNYQSQRLLSLFIAVRLYLWLSGEKTIDAVVNSSFFLWYSSNNWLPLGEDYMNFESGAV